MENCMKVLVIIPPYIPSYFNAGHHLPIFQVGAYLRKNRLAHEVVCIDAAALNYTWKDVCDLLTHKFDVILALNDFDAIDGFERFIVYATRLQSQAKLGTFGRLSKQIPQFFFRFGLDWIASDGDYEATASAMVTAAGSASCESLPGIWTNKSGQYLPPVAGLFLEPEAWEFPDVEEIPYQAYDRLYANDLNKFCGIPDRRELVVPVARGCPIGCFFCDVPAMQGRRERRVSVDRVVSYIEHAFHANPFEYVSFYAPTFTLDPNWVHALCSRMKSLTQRYPWKCVTTPTHLDAALVREMAEAGCVRISVGLETLDPQGLSTLPKSKRSSQERLEVLAAQCRDVGAELNCFVILGLPGDSLQGVEYTVQQVLKSGARVRPTIYTPYHLLRADMTPAEVSAFNRQLFVDNAHLAQDESAYYQLCYANPHDRSTRVMDRVVARARMETA